MASAQLSRSPRTCGESAPKTIVKKTSKRTAGSRKRSRVQRPAAERALVAFADLARRLDVRWYVFGAQAVNLHGFPRSTADLDLTVQLEPISTATLVRELERAGFSPRFTDDAFIATTRVIPVTHRATKLPVDVVLAGPGLEDQFLAEVVIHRVADHDIPVLSAENLIVTKLLASRPKDLEDVRELLAIRGDAIDHMHVAAVLETLEQALDQSDLRALYQRLRDEAGR